MIARRLRVARSLWFLALPCLCACGDTTTDLIVDPRNTATRQSSDEDGSASPEASSRATASTDAGSSLMECESSDDCTDDDDELLCHPTAKRCVECVTDGHCDEVNERCSALLGECALPCDDQSDCDSDDPICDLALRFCVECESDGDCPGDSLCRRSECTE